MVCFVLHLAPTKQEIIKEEKASTFVPYGRIPFVLCFHSFAAENVHVQSTDVEPGMS